MPMRERRMEVNARRSCSDQCGIAAINSTLSVRQKVRVIWMKPNSAFQHEHTTSEQIILREPPRGHTCTIDMHASSIRSSGTSSGPSRTDSFYSKDCSYHCRGRAHSPSQRPASQSGYGHATGPGGKGRVSWGHPLLHRLPGAGTTDMVPLPFLMQTRAAEWSTSTHLQTPWCPWFSFT